MERTRLAHTGMIGIRRGSEMSEVWLMGSRTLLIRASVQNISRKWLRWSPRVAWWNEQWWDFFSRISI
jgi:hypothetical protein